MGAMATTSCAWAFCVANAQPASTRRIGILTAGALPKAIPVTLSDALLDRGWVEGRNVVFERRGADGNSDRVPALAGELAQMHLDVILCFGAVACLGMKNTNTTIPIVSTSGDPVRLGLVSNLSRPERNITGVSMIAPELAAKRLELIRELLPKAKIVGELVDPANTYWQRVRVDYEQTFRTMRMEPLFVEVAKPADIEEAIARIAVLRADALVVRGDPMFYANRERISRLALKHALPTIAEDQRLVDAGVLMSYGPSSEAMDRLIAGYVDRILRGAKATDRPITQPTKFEFVINGNTAKGLGLAIPQSLLLRADKVLQ